MNESRYAALVARGQARLAPVSGDVIDPEPAVSGPHRAVLGFLDDVLGMLAGAQGLPTAARLMLSTVQSQREAMAAALGRLPEAQLRGILTTVRDRIDGALSDA